MKKGEKYIAPSSLMPVFPLMLYLMGEDNIPDLICCLFFIPIHTYTILECIAQHQNTLVMFLGTEKLIIVSLE